MPTGFAPVRARTRSLDARAVALVALASAAPQMAEAQAGPPGDSPWRFSIQSGATYQFDSGLDGGGDVAATRWFVQPGVSYGFDRRTSVGLSVGFGETLYDFSGAGFGATEPWGDIRELRISAPIRFGVTDSVSALVLPSVRWNTETGADLDEGRTEGVIAAAIWRYSDAFSVGPGIGVFTSLDGGTDVFPFLAIDWDITERLNIGTGGGLAATQGPGLTLSYKAREDLTVGIGGRYESSQFALDDRGPAPGGIGEDRAIPLYLTASWTPWPTASVTVLAGMEFGGELKLRDARGRALSAASYDPAPFLGLAGALRF